MDFTCFSPGVLPALAQGRPWLYLWQIWSYHFWCDMEVIISMDLQNVYLFSNVLTWIHAFVGVVLNQEMSVRAVTSDHCWTTKVVEEERSLPRYEEQKKVSHSSVVSVQSLFWILSLCILIIASPHFVW